MSKLSLNKTAIPADQAAIDPEKSTWKDGNLVALDLGDSVEIYIGHEVETVTEDIPDGEPVNVRVVRAFAFRVPKPVTKAGAMNAAEMAAYNLRSAMDVASFNAGLARHQRKGDDQGEAAAHDSLLDWVSQELAAIGIV